MADDEKPHPLINVPQLHGMMGQGLENCGNCSAFRADPMRKGAGIGMCCAHAPTVQLINVMTETATFPKQVRQETQLQGMWPPTEKRRWCREWEPINGSGKQESN